MAELFWRHESILLQETIRFRENVHLASRNIPRPAGLGKCSHRRFCDFSWARGKSTRYQLRKDVSEVTTRLMSPNKIFPDSLLNPARKYNFPPPRYARSCSKLGDFHITRSLPATKNELRFP